MAQGLEQQGVEAQGLEPPLTPAWHNKDQTLDPVRTSLPDSLYDVAPLVRINSPQYIEAVLTGPHTGSCLLQYHGAMGDVRYPASSSAGDAGPPEAAEAVKEEGEDEDFDAFPAPDVLDHNFAKTRLCKVCHVIMYIYVVGCLTGAGRSFQMTLSKPNRIATTEAACRLKLGRKAHTPRTACCPQRKLMLRLRASSCAQYSTRGARCRARRPSWN
jgi:hypothetical protein